MVHFNENDPLINKKMRSYEDNVQTRLHCQANPDVTNKTQKRFQDYYTKYCRVTRSIEEQEFKNPLSSAFEEYLKLSTKVSELKSPDDEYPADYLEKFKKLYPKLGTKYFNTPINEAVLDHYSDNDGHTIYQLDYCDIEKDRQYAQRLKHKRACTLPDDWVLPSTSYLKAYRNPTLLNPKALDPVQKVSPRHHLKGQEKLNKVLKVQTGQTHYQAVYGELGDTIIKEQMHGKIVHPKCTCIRHNPLPPHTA